MQNDFGAKGGMFDRAGIDVSVIYIKALLVLLELPERHVQGGGSLPIADPA